MTLPIGTRGRPSPELDRMLRGGRHQAWNDRIYCSEFFDLLDLYNDRNAIVHEGRLDLTIEQEGATTCFIASRFLLAVLSWFAENPQSDLSDLDAQIDTLPIWEPT